MGYGFYTLPDGREAGYLVDAECDKEGCTEEIDRGFDYLCGDAPDGHRSFDEPGCGLYFCWTHQDDHDCPNPECGKYSTDGHHYCQLPADHDEGHFDRDSGAYFTKTEEDLV
jgi:hypothetical protein